MNTKLYSEEFNAFGARKMLVKVTHNENTLFKNTIVKTTKFIVTIFFVTFSHLIDHNKI